MNWHSTFVFKNDLFTLDRLRSRKDVREVGLTSFRLKNHRVEFKTAAAVIVQNTLTLNINIFYLTNICEKQKRQGNFYSSAFVHFYGFLI